MFGCITCFIIQRALSRIIFKWILKKAMWDLNIKNSIKYFLHSGCFFATDMLYSMVIFVKGASAVNTLMYGYVFDNATKSANPFCFL